VSTLAKIAYRPIGLVGSPIGLVGSVLAGAAAGAGD
jgi:hypothetical protein